MTERVYKKPERPRPKPPWKEENRPGWLIPEPARLAPVGGLFCALIALFYYSIRQYAGIQYGVGPFLVGVSLTFVIGYTTTGLFVYYLLWVAEREFPREEKLDLSTPNQATSSTEPIPVGPEENS
jgi:hypothetical protein